MLQWEANDLKAKMNCLLSSLNVYLQLARTRIELAEGSTERIQKILSSMAHLDTLHTLQFPLTFQKVTYQKVTEPQYTVSRFGAFSTVTTTAPNSMPLLGASFLCEGNTIEAQHFSTIDLIGDYKIVPPQACEKLIPWVA